MILMETKWAHITALMEEFRSRSQKSIAILLVFTQLTKILNLIFVTSIKTFTPMFLQSLIQLGMTILH